MPRQIVIGILLTFGLAGYFSSEPGARPVAVEELRMASAKAVKSMQNSQKTWFEKQTCSSCHHQLLPEISFKFARERTIPIDETIARKHTAASFEYLKDLDSAVQGDFYIDVFYDALYLVGADAAGIKPNLSLAASAQFIASRQMPDGSWPTFDIRPPQAQSFFTATAVSAQAVRLYLPEQLKVERNSRLARARDWLLRSQPRTTEDRAFQLFGLSWTGASESARKKLAEKLMSEQREDGGWSQLPALPSDAYSTGEVLSALHQAAAVAVDSRAYQRGLSFLLKTQQPDGSWHVKSRLHPPAPVSPTYFNSDFPYGK
ncbi:MAG: prenyltransferase/squalene oxidase repeat-containing protein, partial [Acidobacteriota bacterium]